MKLSRMAIDPRKPRKFNTAKVKAYTVYIGIYLRPAALIYTYGVYNMLAAGGSLQVEIQYHPVESTQYSQPDAACRHAVHTRTS